MDAQERMRRALDGFGERLQQTRDDQWGQPTPCTEWDVRALSNHVIGEVRWIPPLLAGKTIADVGGALEGDLLGEDPKGAWDTAAAETLAAIQEPGVLSRTVHLSYGDRSAQEYIDEVAVDLLIHSWDLARGVGADEHLDPELVEYAMPAFSSPGMEGAREAGYFGAIVQVPDDADPQTKLLGLTGRDARAPVAG